MQGFGRQLLVGLRGALVAAGREYARWEADLGLCEHCGERPPPPLEARRRPRPIHLERPRRVA